ncbi:Uncharacterised protein [Escherichia coli]|uniref:Uncharacterized protein n=1 Tax=Escherichia coli TaxID=562 RepID=A0A484X508_ECOLX|nr:Uncharacterised protein [Escherichia coli]
MTSKPVDFTEQQFTLRLQKPQGVPAIEPARALVGSEQFVAQLPRPVYYKHHPAREPKVVNVRSAILTFALQTSRRVMMLKSIDICPAVSFAFTTRSAAKEKGCNGF